MPIRYKVLPKKRTGNSDDKKAMTAIALLTIGIVFILGLFYLWFFVATANLNNFWSLVRGNRDNEASMSTTVSAIPATPTISDVPEAVNKRGFDVKGFASPNQKAFLYVNEVEAVQTAVDADGSFTFSNVPMTSNSVTIYVKVKDTNNKESAPSKTRTIIFDDKPPKLEVKDPSDGDTFKNPSPFYTVTGSVDEDATITVNDRQAILDADMNFRLVVNVNEGDNFLKIEAVDKAGNGVEIARKLIYEKP